MYYKSQWKPCITVTEHLIPLQPGDKVKITIAREPTVGTILRQYTDFKQIQAFDVQVGDKIRIYFRTQLRKL